MKLTPTTMGFRGKWRTVIYVQLLKERHGKKYPQEESCFGNVHRRGWAHRGFFCWLIMWFRRYNVSVRGFGWNMRLGQFRDLVSRAIFRWGYLGGLYFLWWLIQTGTEGLVGLLLMISKTALDVDTTVRECGWAAGAQKVLFSFLGIFFEGSFKNTEGITTYRTLWEPHYSWWYSGWKFYFKKGKEMRKLFCTAFWTSVKRSLVKWK